MVHMVDGQTHICVDPQFFPSTLAFIFGVSHPPNFLCMVSPWPSFRFDRFSSLVQVHLRSNVVRVCSSFWSAIMANSLVVHIMLKEGSEVSPKLQFNWSSQEQVRIRSTWACFGSYLPYPNSELHTIFFLDSLFFKEHCVKI